CGDGPSWGSPVSGCPAGTFKPHHQAVVQAEAARTDLPESEAAVEADGVVVGLQRVDQHGADGRVGEAAGEGLPHHLGAVAAAQAVGLADPDVQRAQVRLDTAPVVFFLAGRVDDLDEADRPAVQFGDQLLAPVGIAGQLGFPAPVVVRVTGDDMRLLVPA